MSSRLYSWILNSRSRSSQSEQEVESNTYPTAGTRYLPWSSLIHWLQTHLVLPAPLPNGGRNLLGFTYTTRVEALVVGGFWFLSTLLSFLGYRTFAGNI